MRLNLSGRLSWRCFYAPAIQRRCAAITPAQNLRLSTAPGGSLRSVVISELPSLPNRGINHAEMSRLQSCVWSDSSPMVGLPVLWKELSPRLSCKTSAADRTRERVACCTRWPEWRLSPLSFLSKRAGGNVLADQCLAVRLLSGGTMPAFGSQPICGVLGQHRQSHNRPDDEPARLASVLLWAA